MWEARNSPLDSESELGPTEPLLDDIGWLVALSEPVTLVVSETLLLSLEKLLHHWKRCSRRSRSTQILHPAQRESEFAPAPLLGFHSQPACQLGASLMA